MKKILLSFLFCFAVGKAWAVGIDYNPGGGVAGPAGADGATGAAGSNGSLVGSTVTTRLVYAGSVYLSTINVCGLPGACFQTGNSTFVVSQVWGQFVTPSTVAMTSIQLVVSTGGVTPPIVFSSTYFPRIDIGTAATTGPSGISTIYSTGANISGSTITLYAGWTVGVQVTTAAISGIQPQGLTVGIKWWEKVLGQ